MRGFGYWILVIAIVFIAVMTPIVLVASIASGIKVSLELYIVGFIELAIILIFISYKILSRKNRFAKLQKKMIPAVIVSCAVSLYLGFTFAPMLEFEGSEKSSSSYHSNYSSYRYQSSWNSSRGSGGSGGTSSTTSRSTPKPRVTSRPSYSSSSRTTPRPQRTVNPEDHDIESYYLDYQDEFEDEDDAWDDFEDDPDVWDDY
ncbi:MAG: hypothetical protein IKQ97_05400 [Eubacterium sp.]|nr:hypothetical protein [Eubacterium sp.]